MKIKIVFMCTQIQRFLGFKLLYDYIRASDSDLEILFYIDNNVYIKYFDIIKENKLPLINDFLLSKRDKVSGPLIKKIYNCLPFRYKRILKRFKDIIESSFLLGFLMAIKEEKYYSSLESNYTKIKNLLLENSINIAFVPGDRHLGEEPSFLKACNTLKIKTIIPYLTTYASEESILRLNSKTKMLKNIPFLSKYVLNSQKTLKYRKSRNNSYFYPHYIANSLQRFGTLSKNPWIMGSGLSSILCVESKYRKKEFIRNGVDEKKIKIVGDVAFDNIYEGFCNKRSLTQKILDYYKLDKRKKNIIVALPQMGEHGLLPWSVHWKEIDFLMEKINELGENLFVSLHPKMDNKEYAYLEEKYDCKILRESLSDVLPIADLFIATYSSTVLWAVLCGINTVIVDFYNLNYSIFDFLYTVRKVTEKEELETVMKNALNNELDYSHDWDSLSRSTVFTGNTARRYIELIYEVANE